MNAQLSKGQSKKECKINYTHSRMGQDVAFIVEAIEEDLIKEVKDVEKISKISHCEAKIIIIIRIIIIIIIIEQ